MEGQDAFRNLHSEMNYRQRKMCFNVFELLVLILSLILLKYTYFIIISGYQLRSYDLRIDISWSFVQRQGPGTLILNYRQWQKIFYLLKLIIRGLGWLLAKHTHFSLCLVGKLCVFSSSI